MSKSKKIATYQFKDSILGVNALVLGNFFLVLLFLIGDMNNLWNNGHAQICLLTSILFFIISKWYNWESQKITLGLVFLYLLLVALEFYLLGMLPPMVEITEQGFVSKGLFMQLLAIWLPVFYVLFRISLVIPLVVVYFKRRNLEGS